MISAALAATAVGSAQATERTKTVDIAGVKSYSEFGESINTVIELNLGAGATITNFNFDVNLSTYGESWLSEMAIYFTNSQLNEGVIFNPAFGFDGPGTVSIAENHDLVAEGLSFNVGSDGVLRLEFAEDFDDRGVSPDAIWNFGTVTFGYDDHLIAAARPN